MSILDGLAASTTDDFLIILDGGDDILDIADTPEHAGMYLLYAFGCGRIVDGGTHDSADATECPMHDTEHGWTSAATVRSLASCLDDSKRNPT